MNLLKIYLIAFLSLVYLKPLIAHNEYLKVFGFQWVTTTDFSEAVTWSSYQNLPINLVFTQTNLPWEMDNRDDLVADFQAAYTQWQDVTNSCVSFLETAGGFPFTIDFSTNSSDFDYPGSSMAETKLQYDFSTNKFITDSYSATYFNNTAFFPWDWRRTSQVNYVCFTHVALHELGHIIGLGHCTAANRPVMKETYNVSETGRLYLQSADEEGLQSLCNNVTDVNDYIWISTVDGIFYVNQQACYDCAIPHFVDEWPYGNYITEWGGWDVYASSSCGDILICQLNPGPLLTIPSLPTGYQWNRDANGFVIATLSTSGTDNDGDIHYASIPIKIGNVPNTFLTSGTLTSDTYWCGDIILTGSITVPIGKTLYVEPGSTIKFPQNSSLIVQGKLDARFCTFTSVSGTTNSSWGSISINGSGSNGSELDAVTVSYGTRVEFINTSNNLVHSCNILNTYDGLRFSGSTGQVYNNTISTNSVGHGIIIENNSNVFCDGNIIRKTSSTKSGVGIIYRGGSQGSFSQNDISGWDWGIGAIWGSSPISTLESGPKNNRITNNRIGVEAYQSSWPILGMFGTNSGYNSIFNNTYKNAYFTSGGTLYAITNFWGGVPNSTMFYLGSNCFIDTRYYLSSDPWSNIMTENFLKEEINNGVLGDLFLEGLLHFRNKKFNKAKDSFISYLNRFPEKQIAYNALFYCLNDETKSDIISFFKSLPAKANSSHKLLLSYIYLKEGQINDAISNNEFIIQNNPNTPLSIEAKTNNLYIELYQNQDFEKACMIYNEIMSQPELSTPLELDMIQSSLESYAIQSGLIFPELELKKAVNNFNLEPVEYSLYSNYPNPFNPSTIINYAIKDVGLVSIRVYDILGAEVMTLVNETKEAGYHSIEFNASQLPSGVYIYTLQVNGYTNSKKMLLLK